MNEEIKIAWIDELLSGRWQQGKHRLRPEDNKYCCLGVLSELAARAGVGEWKSPGSRGHAHWTFHDASNGIQPWSPCELTDGIVRWADLDGSRATIGYLMTLNDNGASFAHIAEVIKDRL